MVQASAVRADLNVEASDEAVEAAAELGRRAVAAVLGFDPWSGGDTVTEQLRINRDGEVRTRWPVAAVDDDRFEIVDDHTLRTSRRSAGGVYGVTYTTQEPDELPGGAEELAVKAAQRALDPGRYPSVDAGAVDFDAQGRPRVAAPALLLTKAEQEDLAP